MDKIKSHKDLRVWQEAMNLVSSVYLIVQQLPNEERFGLTSQIKRSAISIPSNIAEGCARQGNKELVQFLYIAQGSLSELETQLEITQMVYKINVEEDIFRKIIFIRIMLSKFIQSIKNKQKPV